MLAGCLVVIGAAGAAGMVMLTRASTPVTQLGKAVLRIDTNPAGGLATLRVLDTVRLGSSQVVPAGFEVTMPSSSLAEALSPAAVPAVGASLACQVQVGTAQGRQVIDVLRCEPAQNRPG